MIIKCGTIDELKVLTGRIPMEVVKQAENYISILNESYGTERNYYKDGGYVVYAETSDDITDLEEIFLGTSYEWEQMIGNYVIKLYLLGDDFSVVLCHPQNII